MPGYSFRIRFYMAPGSRIGFDGESQVLPGGDNDVRLEMRVLDNSEPIEDARDLLLLGHGFDTEEAAERVGRLVLDHLGRILGRFGLGADFGRRAATGGVFRAFLDQVEDKAGRPAVNDVHGLMVYESEPRPLFVRAGSTNLIKSRQGSHFLQAFQATMEEPSPLSDRERWASDLYNIAHFARYAEPRFLLLVTAVEALIKQQLRPEPVRALVEEFIERTNESDLPDAEKDSLVGTLRHLRQESIRRAGRRMVRERLGDREYREMPAPRFFSEAYSLRSRLVHGHTPEPTKAEVDSFAAQMEVFVGHLLAGPLLDLDV